MEKASTSKSEHRDVGKVRKKSTEVPGEVAHAEQNEQVVPLHRRRFDAKHRELPRGLTALPQSNSSSKKPDDPRRFCEELTERLRLEGPSLPELRPLSERSASTAAAIVATEEAFDHLDSLYKLMDQLLTLKDHNSKLQRRARDLAYLKNLRDMHKQIEHEIQRAKTTDMSVLFGDEATCMDLEEEYGYTEDLLDSMLAAGRNASLKRAKWKSPSRSKIRQSLVGKQRSRSMGGEELEACGYGDGEGEYSSRLEVPYRGRPRRASDLKGSDEKSKISKWTRVKAAFKWEKAHTGVVSEAPPAAQASLATPSPLPASQSVTPLSPTPGSISSASSVEELRSDQLSQRHESTRRSRSLDSSVVLEPLAGQLPNDDEVSSPSSSKLPKTPWGKMKDIIQTRKESVKKNKTNRNSVKSNSDGKTSENHSLSDGGCVSHSESAEVIHDLSAKPPRRKTSSQEKPESTPHQDSLEMLKRTTPTLTVTMPSSEELAKANRIGDSKADLVKCTSQSYVGSQGEHLALRKQKSLDQVKKSGQKQLGSVVQDSSDADTGSPLVQRRDSKWKKVKKAFLTSASMSTPSSPNRHSAFFADYDGDELSSGDFSQAGKPFGLSGISENTARGRGTDGAKETIQDEIRRDYEALQCRLSREFSARALGWASSNRGSPPGRSLDWDKARNLGGFPSLRQPSVGSGPPTPSAVSGGASVQTQERLEADFRRRLQENQRPRGSAAPVLSQAQLSEDFRKKLEEWKRLKATNSVPAYTAYAGDEADRPPRDLDRDDKHIKYKKVATPKKEVLVQTGAGFFRFEGISRSFTRKLHEWEKSRGIAPEASTSALLKESLARPPLPGLRTIGFGPWPSGHERQERPTMGMFRLQRSQSVGSVREEGGQLPDQLAPGQASSLSLNRLDECKDDQVSDTELLSSAEARGPESDSDGGPAALLVEVEDEEEETAAPLVACTPRPAPQTPVYRYGQAQERHRACEITEGKLSPIAHAVPVPPHPGTNQIAVMVAAAAKLLEEEEALQKLVQGHRNISERCDDVTRQIDDIKAQPIRSLPRLGELERRASRLSKEKGILENSVKERASLFNKSVNDMKRNIDIFKNKCDKSSDSLINIAADFIEKFDQFSAQSDVRVNNLKAGKSDCVDFSNDLRNIQRSIDGLQSECDKCNMKRRDSNICVSYRVNRPKLKGAADKNKSDVGENIHATENKPLKEQVSTITSISLCDTSLKIHNTDENKGEDLENVVIVSERHSAQDDSEGTAKGAKKKTKEPVEKGATNSAKRKAKARQRLEKEKSLQSESDSEEEVSTVTIEFPRRRKLTRTRRISDTHVAYPRQNSFEKQSNTDSGDNVYVLKLKSNTHTDHSANEKDSPLLDRENKRMTPLKKRSLDSTLFGSKSEKNLATEDSVQILISPEQFSIDIPPEGIEIQAAGTAAATAAPDVFVKTTRKIFSPVRRDSKGKPKAVIGFDLEEIANSIEKRRVDMTHRGDEHNQDNLPDIIFNSEVKKADIEAADQFLNKTSSNDSPVISETKDFNKFEENKREFTISNSQSLSSIRSHTPSPLYTRKCVQQNSSSRTLSGSRNPSDESIHQSKDVFPIRRGSGERFLIGCKGSPVLSRSSTPGVSSASCSLPPLPASPPASRRDKAKDTAPSIRIMIQKYNMRLNEEGAEAKPPTGSSTPPWRSPRSQERFPHDVQRVLHHSTVRNNPFFSREVQKSASASQIMKKPAHSDSEQKPSRFGNHGLSKDNISDSSEMTPPMPKKLLRGILKSSSAGSLKTTSPISRRKDFTEPTEHGTQAIPAASEQKYKRDLISNTDNKIIGVSEKPAINDNKTEREVDKKYYAGVNVDKSGKDVKRDDIKVKVNENTKPKNNRSEMYRQKIDTELLKRAMSTPCAPMLMEVEKISSINRSGSRAMRLKKAKEQFLASDPKYVDDNDNAIRRDRTTSSHVDLVENRLSQISCGSDTSYEGNSLVSQARDQDGGLLMKSASVGMINMERDAFDQFSRQKGYESLPRNQSNLADAKDLPSKSGSKFGLSNIASKFRKVRMRKGKQNKNVEKNEEKEKLNTITRLCRQSLLVNLHGRPDPGAAAVNIQKSKDNGGSQTNMSIVSAGKTGGAVAVGSAGFFTAEKGVCRSLSMPDGSSGSKNTPI